jgi:hypothetical protein
MGCHVTRSSSMFFVISTYSQTVIIGMCTVAAMLGVRAAPYSSPVVIETTGQS